MARYRAIANEIIDDIVSGGLDAGDKVPSLRDACLRWRVSLITVKGAYRLLEQQGFIEARPQSGYYVLPRLLRQDPKAYTPRGKIASPSEELHIISQIMGAQSPDAIRALGAAIPGAEILPLKTLRRYAARVARRSGLSLSEYGHPSGSERLREAIARHYRSLKAKVLTSDIVIHNGALDAITTTLRSLTRPGDRIVLESPTYYLFMHAAAALNLRVIPIRHIPGEGIDLALLRKALASHSIKAMVVIPNFHNPTGSLMSLAAKLELLDIAHRHGTSVIEDDVYGELAFNGERPIPLLALDTKGIVVHCSSASKLLGPALRVGWSISRRYHAMIEGARFLESISCPSLTQEVVAEYLTCEGLKRHTRLMTSRLALQAEEYYAALKRSLPIGSRVTRPQGGFLFWVELPRGADTTELFASLASKRTGLTPGIIFGNHPEAKRFFRLSCGSPLSPRIEESIVTIGEAASHQIAQRTR
jgi:DNA-binding transcriptional MocR family regulator